MHCVVTTRDQWGLSVVRGFDLWSTLRSTIVQMENETGRPRPEEPPLKRRVSISDQVLGVDNPAFEHHHHHRRISASSEHNSEAGSRKKSILHHGASHENLAQYKFDLENGRINGNRKKSAFSLSSSIRDKIEYSEELERWVFFYSDDSHFWSEPIKTISSRSNRCFPNNTSITFIKFFFLYLTKLFLYYFQH